jgi:hypothetical protein
MKKITQEEIEKVMRSFYDANVSVQTYEAIQKFFADLPEIETPLPKK